ncbi:MAG: sugar-phosphatase [Lactobacillaceae bacterium]|jgi:Cof subfamily protein (haloacid dehalogenase superfamily)|nr:sugar-phosphatase [Lactobacillaceae bacterium]
MTIKLITIDVDGTLVNSKSELTQHTIDILKKAIDRGVKIVIASGRPTAGTKNFFQALGIDNLENQYAINYNGAIVANTKGDVITEDTLTFDDYKKIAKLADELNIPYQIETADYIITPFAKIPKYTVFEANLVNMPVWHLPIENTPTDSDIAKVMFIDEPEKIEKTLPLIPATFKQEFNVMKSAPVFIEFIKKTVSKGLALQQLAEKLKIDISQTMAIGDQGNDLSMLEKAGVSVAMGNAIPELKQIADFVTKTNDEDGVAYAIEKFILNDN